MQAENDWDVLANDEEDDQLRAGVSLSPFDSLLLTKTCYLPQYIESLKDVILFAVDCSKSMLEPQMNTSRKKGSKPTQSQDQPSATYSHMFTTLRAAVELQKRKAMYEPNDMVGILLFNVVCGLGYTISLEM